VEDKVGNGWLKVREEEMDKGRDLQVREGREKMRASCFIIGFIN